MTVIAYVNKKLYADRLHMHDLGNLVEKRKYMSKIHVNEDNTIAFCSTGLEINPSSLNAIFIILSQMIELFGRIGDVNSCTNYLNDDSIKLTLAIPKRYYIVITKTQVYLIDEVIITICDSSDIITHGNDGNYFKALALAGVKPEKIIPHIYDNLSTGITREFDTFSQSSLKELKFLDHELNKDRAINNLKDKVKSVAENIK